VPADGLTRVRVDAGDAEALAWADGLQISVPDAVLAAASVSGGSLPRLRVSRHQAAMASIHVDRMRLRAAFTTAPASARLPFNYRAVPGPLRRTMARVLGRIQRRRVDRWASFPAWPLDVTVDVLADWAGLGHHEPRPPDRSAPAPVLLTHDIDSPEGLRNLTAHFLAIEEAVGARSTSFIVPCGWPLDDARLEEVSARGHLLGVHGYDHANRTPFAADEERRSRLDAARPLAERFGMSGYRAPSLLRTPELLADLAVRYAFDSSIPTSGGLFPVPNNGCATTRPFRIGELHEIPITLPRDGSLLFLGHRPDEILALWKSCAELVARARGVVVILTHCEPHFSGNPRMLATYRTFLQWIRDSPRFAWSTPADVLARA
jgi:peptidoglycan/xylan/chitin deacetylase (PgdA/CDA1 family)